MRDFNSLASAGKEYGMVANDIAATYGGKTDGRGIALSSHAVARVHANLI